MDRDTPADTLGSRRGEPSSSRSGRRVLVYGAGGHTGRFVVAELLRRGLVPVLSGRDGPSLAATGARHPGLDRRPAAVDDGDALDRALHDVHAVINCAGPFLDTAAPVASAAVRAGAHYLDVSAEQASAAALHRDLADDARAARVVVMPSMAFYGGLADLAATAALDGRGHADEITTAIALDRWWPTEGTRRTGARNTGPRLVVSDGRLTALEEPAPSRTWTFPAPFGSQEVVALPFSEIIAIASHLPVTTVRSYLSRAPLDDLHDERTPPPSAVDDSGRSAQRFLLQVVVREGRVRRSVTAAGQDIYAVTAPIVVEAATRVLARTPTEPIGGVTAPGAFFDPDDFLDALTGHLVVRRTTGSERVDRWG